MPEIAEQGFNEVEDVNAGGSGGGGGGATTLTSGDIALILEAEIEPGVSLLQSLRLVLAVLAGDAAVTGATVAFKRQDGQTTALTISSDVLGNRSGSTVGSV